MRNFVIIFALILAPLFADAQSVLFPNRGGTGTTSIPSVDTLLIGNSGGTYSLKQLVAGSNVTISTSSNQITISASGVGGGGGATTTLDIDGVDQGNIEVLDFASADFTIVESPTNDFDIVISSSIARDVELHDAVTLSGTRDYITLSGQDIIRGVIDISDDTNLSVSATGLNLSADAIALTSGYVIPLSASTTDWQSFYTTPSTVITAGTGIDWSGNTLNVTVVDTNTTYTAGDALTLVGTTFNFDGGATPGGELGGSWASPTIDDSLAVTSWNLTTPTLTSFFGTPCTGNEFLQDISDTGAFTCAPAVGGGGDGLATSTAVADTYVIYGTSASTVGGEAAFTYDDNTNLLTVGSISNTNSTSTNLAVTGVFNFLGNVWDNITDVRDYVWGTLSGGTGITFSSGAISFDCSEVEGTGINCSGENITLDATGDWTGTLDTYEASALLSRTNHTGTQAVSTISDFDTEVSNNTDVASNTAARHAAITLSGALDYITLVGQDIVRGAIDLATDITGVLGIANGGLGAAFTDPNADRLMFFDDSSGFITGIQTLTGLSISGTTLTVTDVTCTDCLTTTEIADSYLLNNGDVGTGVYDFGGATSLEIVNGTAPTVNATGELAFDTTDNQLLVGNSGNAARVIRTEEKIFGFTLASTSPEFVSGGQVPVPLEKDGYTVSAIRCYVQAGTSVQMTLTDGTNAMDTLTCATTATSDDGSIANSSVTAAELMYVNVGTISGTPDYVTYAAFGYYTAE